MWPTRYFYPEAVGYLVARTVRCGKVNCRCRRLGERHGPYWYLYYRAWDGERWRQRARYVRADRVEALRRRLERVKAADRAITDLFRGARTFEQLVERLLACLSSQGRLPETHLEIASAWAEGAKR